MEHVGEDCPGAVQFTELRLAPEHIRSAVLRMTEAVTDLAGEVVRRERRSGLSHPILEKLSRSIVDRARRLAPKGLIRKRPACDRA
jgi:hypothetical protein